MMGQRHRRRGTRAATRSALRARGCAIVLGPWLFGCALSVWFAPAVHAAPYQGSGIDPRAKTYGAKCDWDGSKGTDDTAAFQAAADAASAAAKLDHRSVSIRVPFRCEVAGRVTFGSGVHWVGPGSIIVPLQTAQTFYAKNADDVAVEEITFQILSNHCGNNSQCAAIFWGSTDEDAGNHSGVTIRKNAIVHANWGILVQYTGKGRLSDVVIADNIVESPGPYMDADGIHVAGGISRFLIAGNRVSNRDDAGIAATSETPEHICSGGMVRDNVLLEDRVGLDNSGCRDVVYQGNLVRATTSARASNPAFRSIVYLGVTPHNIGVVGNYFQNGAGAGEAAAKVDNGTSEIPTDVRLSGNVIPSLYLRGTNIQVYGNTFLSHASLSVDFDGTHNTRTDDVWIGENVWLGAGELWSGDNKSLLTNIRRSPQLVAEPLRVLHKDIFTPIASGDGAGDVNAAEAESGRVLRTESSFTALGSLDAGTCESTEIIVPGVRTSMAVRIAGEDESQPGAAAVSWAYVVADDHVVVKRCALQKMAASEKQIRVSVYR